MQDLIHQNQEEWVSSGRFERLIDGYADRAGLDRARYQSCVRERRTWGQVLADKALGDSIGINGTPTFFVNGRRLKDTPTVDQLVRIVDSIATTRGTAGVVRAARR